MQHDGQTLHLLITNTAGNIIWIFIQSKNKEEWMANSVCRDTSVVFTVRA